MNDDKLTTSWIEHAREHLPSSAGQMAAIDCLCDLALVGLLSIERITKLEAALKPFATKYLNSQQRLKDDLRRAAEALKLPSPIQRRQEDDQATGRI